MVALRKVLVVDDDPVVAKSFNRVLSEGKGYVVITAQNAAEALEKMREQEYDVVFTDIKMPGMDGVELAEKVKARRPWTPVVIVTGYGTTANEERARAAGVSDFMHKPLTPEMIEESAAHAMLTPVAAAVAAQDSAAVVQAPAAPAAPANGLKTIALVLATPFIGLLYALALPLVGLAALAWMGAKAYVQSPRALAATRNVALFLAAPFIGLLYALALPMVGLATLAWMGAKALAHNQKAMTHVKYGAGLVLAPIVGLIFAVFLPLIGIFMLAWEGATSFFRGAQVK